MLDSWRRNGYTVMVIDDIHNPDDAAADVRLVFDAGDRYAVTFYSAKKLAADLETKRAEKKVGRRYIGCSDVILVERVTLEVIAAVIDELVDSGEYDRVMQMG